MTFKQNSDVSFRRRKGQVPYVNRRHPKYSLVLTRAPARTARMLPLS
jgi:hypothetical protein